MANVAGVRQSDNVEDMRSATAYERQLAQEYYGAAQGGNPLSLVAERLAQTLSNPTLSSKQYEAAIAEAGRMIDQERARVESTYQHQADLARGLHERGVISAQGLAENMMAAMQARQEALAPLTRAESVFGMRGAASIPQIAGMVARDLGLSRPQGIPGVTDKMIDSMQMSAKSAQSTTPSERAKDFNRREQAYYQANVPTKNIDQRTSGSSVISVPEFGSMQNRADTDFWSADVGGFRAAGTPSRAAKSVADVVLGEALSVGKGNVLGSYQDMLAIASVIDNRSKQLGVSPQDVISAVDKKGNKQFDAYDKALPKDAEKNAWMAEQALAEVAAKGPIHDATFYATPSAAKGLPPGLTQVAATSGHVYFSDPQSRSILTAQGYKSPQSPTQVAGTAAVPAGPRADPTTAFMSAITPPAAPSIIDRAFPQAPAAPYRSAPVPSFMSGVGKAVKSVAGAVKDAAIGVRDAAFPGIADRSAWKDGTLSPIDVSTGYQRDYGPQRPADPKDMVMANIQSAVGSYFGPGYTVVGKSGTGNYGKQGHRPDATGKGVALDFQVKGPNGVIKDQATMHGFIGHLAEQYPTASIGYDKSYMGTDTIHVGFDERAQYWGMEGTKHPILGKPAVHPDFVKAVLEGRARAAHKAANPQLYGGIPSIAPRGGLATAQELAAERAKMAEAYAPYQQSLQARPAYAPTMPSQMPTGIGQLPAARAPYSPTMPTQMPTGIGRMPAAPLMMSRQPLPSIPPASKRPGAVVAGVRPSLPPAGLPPAKAQPTIEPNKVQTTTFGPSGVPVSVKGGSKQAVALERAYKQLAFERNRAPAVAVSRQAPAKESVGRQDYVSPAREFDRLVTRAGIPSLPAQKSADVLGPARAPAKESVGRKDYVSAAKEFDRLVTSAGIPSLPSVAYDPSRAKESIGRKDYTAPSPARSEMQTWSNPPAAPSRAAPAPARTSDFRQSPAEARAQQLNMMHDKLSAPAKTASAVSSIGISMPADLMLNRQSPASIAGVRSAPAAPKSAPAAAPASQKSFEQERQEALSKYAGMPTPMQVDKHLAAVAIQNLPALASVAAKVAPNVPSVIQNAPKGVVMQAAPKAPVTAPSSGPSQSGSVVSSRTNDGGVRSVDTRSGWSSYTSPTTGVTTTFTPDGQTVGGGQGMLGGGIFGGGTGSGGSSGSK